MRFGDNRFRVWLTAALLVLIGLATYRIGLYSWGSYHRRAADAALARRDFIVAQRELASCLWVWPDRSELRLLLAQTARRRGKLPEAGRLLGFCQDDSGLADAVGLEQCLIQIQKGDLASADQLDQYGSAFPDTHEAMLIEEAQIVGSLAALDVPRARAYLAMWNQRRQSPADRVQGLLWAAMACLLAKEAEQAEGCFREAVQLAPGNREARLGMAQLLAHSDPAEAAQHLQVLRQAHSADSEIRYQQAVVERNLGQVEAAGRSLDELLAQVPDHVEGLVLRGRIALDLRQIEEAGRWFRRAEEFAPKRHAVLLAMLDYSRLTGHDDDVDRYEQRLQEVVQHLKAMLERGSQPPVGTPVQRPVVSGPASR